jgi:hypothetical protein
MSSPEEIFRQIEGDRAVREREVRLIGNAARRAVSDAERDMLFRTSVLLTYAHLEGFCRFALIAYASAINTMKLTCNEASFALVAASLTRLFGALRHPQSKHDFFVRTLPDDAKLHLTAREREFVENLESAMQGTVELPDDVVDTESNLSSIVLMKNLYRLGLNYPVVEEQNSQINKLLGVRNAIAHGDFLKVPRPEEVENYVSTAFGVMSFIQREIFNALSNGAYRRTQAA